MSACLCVDVMFVCVRVDSLQFHDANVGTRCNTLTPNLERRVQAQERIDATLRPLPVTNPSSKSDLLDSYQWNKVFYKYSFIYT